MSILARLASFCCLTACAAMALADDAFIYPKNDQTMEQHGVQLILPSQMFILKIN